jgi:hypothetical protein
MLLSHAYVQEPFKSEWNHKKMGYYRPPEAHRAFNLLIALIAALLMLVVAVLGK